MRDGIAARLSAPLVAAACLLTAGVAQHLVRQIDADDTLVIPPPSEYLGVSLDPRIIRRLLGAGLLAADLVWVDTLLKSDTTREGKPYTSIYHAFRNSLALDPDNVQGYYVAGMYLSVVKDDIKGATSILRQGVERLDAGPYSWPNAWNLLFALGYNLIFEENDIEEGSRYIGKAAQMEHVPQAVKALALHVSTERGRLDVGQRVLNDLYRRATHPDERRRIEAKLMEIEGRFELVDLNEKFQRFLDATHATAFSKKKQLQLFLRSIGRRPTDLLGRPLGINTAGKIAPVEQ